MMNVRLKLKGRVFFFFCHFDPFDPFHAVWLIRISRSAVLSDLHGQFPPLPEPPGIIGHRTDILENELQRCLVPAARLDGVAQIVFHLLPVHADTTDKCRSRFVGDHIIMPDLFCGNIHITPGTAGDLADIGQFPDQIILAAQLLMISMADNIIVWIRDRDILINRQNGSST